MDESESFGGVVVTILLVSAMFWFFGGDNKAEKIEQNYGYQVETTVFGGVDCSSLEPENPYSYDTGHYAGYEWYENNGYCTEGNSESFYEGCLDAESQDEAYAYCLDN